MKEEEEQSRIKRQNKKRSKKEKDKKSRPPSWPPMDPLQSWWRERLKSDICKCDSFYAIVLY